MYTARISNLGIVSAMNREPQISWRRHIVFDPMNAHSQADDPALMYVMQFNADERECQDITQIELAKEKKRGPAPKLQRPMECIRGLPKPGGAS